MLRKPTTTHDTEQHQIVSEHPPGDDNRNVPALPKNGPDTEPERDMPPGIEEFFRTVLDEQFVRIETLLADTAKQCQETESHFQIVAECQKQTAAFANGLVARHALHPAIETVHELTVLLRQLKEQAFAAIQPHTQCPVFGPLLEAIDQAEKLAAAKYDYLGAEIIEPSPDEAFDRHRHEIQKAVTTDDPAKHGVIESTMVAGLVYRDKILRLAKVAVYRHIDKSSERRTS